MIDAVTRLRDATGYSGRVFDPELDALIRRLAELTAEVVEDAARLAELAQARRFDA